MIEGKKMNETEKNEAITQTKMYKSDYGTVPTNKLLVKKTSKLMRKSKIEILKSAFQFVYASKLMKLLYKQKTSAIHRHLHIFSLSLSLSL